MIYRITYTNFDGSNEGYSYATSFADAAKIAAEHRREVRRQSANLGDQDEWPTGESWADLKDEYSDAAIITAYPTPKNKREVLRLLKDVAGHPNNGDGG